MSNILPVTFHTKHEVGVEENLWSFTVLEDLHQRGCHIEINALPKLDRSKLPAQQGGVIDVILVDSAAVRHFSPFDPRDSESCAGVEPWTCQGTWGVKIGQRAVSSLPDLRSCSLTLMSIFIDRQRKPLGDRKYPWVTKPRAKSEDRLHSALYLERSVTSLW